MAATEKSKIDLYLLKDGPTSDDYSSRKLACSDVPLVLRHTTKKVFCAPKSTMILDADTGRIFSHLLLPGRVYRMVENEEVQYLVLLNYLRSGRSLTLEIQLL